MKVVIVFAIIVYASFSYAQEYELPEERADVTQFFFDALVFAGDDSATSRLDVYVLVPYSTLRFVQANNNYDATYEETISIYDEDNNLIVEKLSTERIRRADFTETVDPTRHNLTQRFFPLKTGPYTIAVQVQDGETRKMTRNKRDMTVRSMRDSMLSISDLMLVNQLRSDGDRKTIVPNITGNVGNLPDGFYLFCEVYNRTGCDTFDVTYQIKSAKNVEKIKEQFLYPAVAGRNQLFVKINSGNLPLGTYVVELQAVACGKDAAKRRATSVVTHPFVIRWSGIPASIEDLDLAIEQLVYLAEPKEIDEIKAAPISEEKKKRFYEFWKKRDPSPNTERNETMEQYYNRVAFANKTFSHYVDGWKTDRGMVYIMFGPPNSVDRHPFDSNAKPYELWFYNELNYRFLFVDQTGFGDYRLDPSTPLWNIKNRQR